MRCSVVGSWSPVRSEHMWISSVELFHDILWPSPTETRHEKHQLLNVLLCVVLQPLVVKGTLPPGPQRNRNFWSRPWRPTHWAHLNGGRRSLLPCPDETRRTVWRGTRYVGPNWVYWSSTTIDVAISAFKCAESCFCCLSDRSWWRWLKPRKLLRNKWQPRIKNDKNHKPR